MTAASNSEARKRAQDAQNPATDANSPVVAPEPTGRVNEAERANLDLDAIRARAEAATPGPWRFCNTSDTRGRKGEFRGPSPHNGFMLVGPWTNDADIALMTHARADIPLLLAALDEARNAAEAWQVAHNEAETRAEREARVVREAEAKALRAMSAKFRTEARETWGGDVGWSTTGSKVAALAASWCNEEAERIEAVQ